MWNKDLTSRSIERRVQVQITLYNNVEPWAQLNKTKKEEVLSLLFVCLEYITDIYLLLDIISIA